MRCHGMGIGMGMGSRYFRGTGGGGGGAEDLRWGDGRIADGARVVHMHVNGRVLCALCTAAARQQQNSRLPLSV